MMIMTYILTALLCTISALTYTGKLTEPGMILSHWKKFLNQKIGSLRKSKKPSIDWLYDPIIGCKYCVSGQFALWVYLFKFDEYDILGHIGFVCLSIFFVDVIEMMINGRTNRT